MSELTKERRNDIARDALDIGMDDNYWLCNLRVDVSYHEGIADLIDTAQRLREDADLLEEAHDKMEEGEFTGAEASVYIARRANYGDYDLHHWLDQDMPITEEPYE